MLRNAIVVVAIALGLYAFWDYSKPRALEPTLSTKWTPAPSPLDPRSSIPEPKHNGGVPPWNENEKIFQNSRNLMRKSVMRSLEQPWGSFCEGDGRKRLDQAVTSYFERFSDEREKYAKRWGDDGRQYIAKEWSTPDDQRIQRLVQEHYERGYLNLADFRPTIAARMSPLLKDSRVGGQPCRS
jgi:hypothetical protein